jgi:hypothetical protein
MKITKICWHLVTLTSGGVALVTFGVRRSIVGFELMDRGDRSTERRELCRGESESDSDLATPRLSWLTLGVAGDGLLGGVSDKPDLFKF